MSQKDKKPSPVATLRERDPRRIVNEELLPLAGLPPVADDTVREAVEPLLHAEDPGVRELLAADPPEAIDAGFARSTLAELLRIGAEGADTTGYELHLYAFTLAVLAVAPKLEPEGRGGDAAAAARANVSFVMKGPRAAELRPKILRFLGDVRDDIALEAGRATFVHRARRLLEYVATLHPHAVDLDKRRHLLLGQKALRFRRPTDRKDGRRGTEYRYLGLGNREGRLLLLAIAGRPPQLDTAAIASHVRAALRVATGDSVRLDGALRLEPALHLSARAQRALASIRHL